MTTKVTIDAHAGWPVLVTLKRGAPGNVKTVETVTVEPHKEHTVYIHSGLQIIGVEEQPLPTTPNMTASPTAE